MRTRKARRVTARYKWDRLKVSFWFAPVVMSLGAILLAGFMYWVDGRIPAETLQERYLILSGTPSELRTLLIGMASTILATAGVVFTLLTLPLSTVAAQYGSRLLRVFLGDRTTQLVLGMFVATFVYCLVAALAIPPTNIEPQGPRVTATVGLVLMLGTFGSLILLVQHISTMLQAPNIVAAAGAELREVVRAEIPEEIRNDDHREAGLETRIASLVETDGYAVRVRRTGYIQYIDPQNLMTLARERNLVIRLLYKPGQVVFCDTRVALVWPAAQVDDGLDRQIRNAFRIGNGRTPTQDVAYAFNQLVEIAVRAMSPAINDPFTAMTCLDYMGEGLVLFIRQGEKDSHFYDQDNQLRLILKPVTVAELASTAFDMLRHCSCDNAGVLLYMLDVIDTVGQEASLPTVKNSVEVREELLRQVNLIQDESQAGALIEPDRERISQRCIEVADLLQTNI
jgi:uncharacterized membrane protein